MDRESRADGEPRGDEEARPGRAKRDVWERTLAQISSTFGKIAYLTSLRNENSGRYQHFGLAQIYSEDEADLVLRQSHEEVFREWLNYLLEPQVRDVEKYLDSIEDERETVLETWLTLEPYRRLLPAAASEAERDLYVTDLQLVLDLLRNEFASGA